MSSKITIDLSELDSTSPLNVDKLIFRDQYDSLLQKIKETLDANILNDRRERDNKTYEPKQTPFFFINGDRGSGKSTLLRAIRHTLLNNVEQGDNTVPYHIQLLAEVDPTIMAPSENFFILVLSCICKNLSEKEHLKDQKRALYQKAIQLIQEMSTGLKLLVSSNTYLQKIAESETFIEDSVEQCTSSSELKRKFGELIDTLCDITSTDAFLITIDDADMSFKKGYEIMEYTRTYMKTPRLLFIFAGDMNHYSLVIRGKQLEEFGHAALQHDKEMEEHRSRLLASIGEQYLLKFFPVGHLINLSNFGELLQKSDSVIIKPNTPQHKGNANEQTLKALLTPYFSIFSSPKYVSSIHDFFSGLPIRTAFQLLKSLDFPQANSYTERQKILNTFAESVMTVASHALILHQIDFKSIHNGNFKTLLKTVFSHICDLGSGNEIPRLLPNTGTNSQKMVSMFLAAEIAKGLTIHQMLTYIGSIFPHLELSMAQYEIRSRRYSRFYRNSEDNRAYLYNITIEFSEQLGEQATACIAESIKANARIKSYGKGIIPLLLQDISRRHTASKESRLSLVEYIKEVPSHLSETESRLDIIFILGIYHSLILTTTNKTSKYCLSVYKLLACAEHILKTAHNANVKETDYEQHLKNNIREILLPDYHTAVISDNNGIDNTSTFINDELPDKLLEFVMQGKTDTELNGIIDDVYVWAVKFCGGTEQTSPAEFNDTWQAYMKICNKLTEQAIINAMNNDNMYSAVELYIAYMNAFTQTVGENMKSNCNLCTCLVEFPLWKSIITGKEEATPLFTLTSKLSTVKAETTGDEALERMRLDRINYSIDFLRDQRLNITKTINIEKDNKFLAETTFKQQNEEVSRLKEDKIKQSKRIREIRAAIAKKNEEITEINNQLEEINKRSNDIKERLQLRERHYHDSEEKHEKALQDVISAKNKIDVLESQLSHLQNLINGNSTGKQTSSLHQYIQSNSELIQKEKEKLNELKEEAKRHEIYKSSLSLRLERLRRDINDLTLLTETKQQELHEETEKRTTLNVQLEEAEKELSEQQMQLQTIQQELTQTRRNIDSAGVQINTLEAKLDSIEQDLEKAQSQRRFIENNLRSLTDD